ncbi:protein yippee-like 5 [Pistacia vera]|uniref:protein yippee-like 5 n=1 Tax=Pistacia vera TaxID=55513 RepID=UPI0012634EED|nr:protein yippee-like 5 [Pistacia vera]
MLVGFKEDGEGKMRMESGGLIDAGNRPDHISTIGRAKAGGRTNNAKTMQDQSENKPFRLGERIFKALLSLTLNLVVGQATSGRAFLFSHAINIVEGLKENRHLITGLHTVADVFCSDCGETLGWKYERAYDESQKYKEGKVVLENFKIVKENW